MITLPAAKTVTIVPAKTIAAVTKSITTLTIVKTVDDPVNKRVYANVQELTQAVILWDDSTTPVSYDAIGQWTDSDVQARLLQLFS